MFLILIDYTAGLSTIDEALDDHATWLDEHYKAGLFLASGRREPRTGGVIFAQGDRPAVEAAAATDPFAVRGLADHTIVEVRPSKFGGPLEDETIRAALA